MSSKQTSSSSLKKRNSGNGYSFTPIFEAETPRQFSKVLRDLVDENDEQSVRFVKKVEAAVTKMMEKEKKENINIAEAFSNRCEDRDLKLAFDFFDLDKDGFLNLEEINNVLKALGENDFELPKNLTKLNFEYFKKVLKF